jgi:hypothetical protein
MHSSLSKLFKLLITLAIQKTIEMQPNIALFAWRPHIMFDPTKTSQESEERAKTSRIPSGKVDSSKKKADALCKDGFTSDDSTPLRKFYRESMSAIENPWDYYGPHAFYKIEPYDVIKAGLGEESDMYTIVRKLGFGAGSTVWLAEHEK